MSNPLSESLNRISNEMDLLDAKLSNRNQSIVFDARVRLQEWAHTLAEMARDPFPEVTKEVIEDMEAIYRTQGYRSGLCDCDSQGTCSYCSSFRADK